jgi:PPK2 family polyphosphate:nucleotide phosphotransferase
MRKLTAISLVISIFSSPVAAAVRVAPRVPVRTGFAPVIAPHQSLTNLTPLTPQLPRLTAPGLSLPAKLPGAANLETPLQAQTLAPTEIANVGLETTPSAVLPSARQAFQPKSDAPHATPQIRSSKLFSKKKGAKIDTDLLDATFDGASPKKDDYDSEAFRAPLDLTGAVDLSALDPERTPGFKPVGKHGNKSNAAAYKLMQRDVKVLQELQNRLYAEKKRSVLIVFQAMDTGGKDGTIRHVLGALNPQGVNVTPFKKPTEAEVDAGYLSRIQAAVPGKGFIGVFNRSHYEDILVPSVLGTIPAATVKERYEQIRQFEEYLESQGTLILKFFLHTSKAEQKVRLQARLDDPKKHWKFSKADLKMRKLWEKFLGIYEKVLARTSTAYAPWYIIPANNKWFRNFLIARIIRRAMESMDLRYPEPEEGLDKVVIPD